MNATPTPVGYAHPDYAVSLAEFGKPRRLPASGGWILERPIAGTPDHDAMGCYPLFAGLDYARLAEDLETHGTGLVSLAVVTDPFGNYDEARLRHCFPDRLIPFKRHFVADTKQPIETYVSRHHRYYARKSLEQVRVEACDDPGGHLDEWTALYALLSARHGLQGVKAFSRQAFELQLRIPGLVMLRAEHAGATVGIHLWFVQGDVAYSHLAATSDKGYELMAAYAIYWRALEIFRGRVAWVSFGAGAGLGEDPADGLARFKRGWATGTRTAYFGGRVLDRVRYEKIAAASGHAGSGYFPAYRAGEFG